jgi:acyl-CoA thioesterase-1
VVRANLEGMLKIAQGRGLAVLIIGVPAPGNFGADYKAAFEANFAELAEAYGALLYPDFFAALGDDPAQVRDLMQEDGIHPDATGVARIVESLGPEVQALATRVREGG